MPDPIRVPLSNSDSEALIDPADAETVLAHRWSLNSKGYVTTYVKSRTVRLHRLLLDAQPGEQIDHANRDKLDNRRANLRRATASQNNANMPPRRGARYKGVSHSPGRGWRARLEYDGRKRHLGYYATAEEAALAYDDEAALALHGEYAYLNRPTPTTPRGVG